MSLLYICRPRNYKKGHKRGMMRLGKKGKVIEYMRLSAVLRRRQVWGNGKRGEEKNIKPICMRTPK